MNSTGDKGILCATSMTNDATCFYFEREKCKSCSYLPLPYVAQLELKQGLVQRAFEEHQIQCSVPICTPAPFLLRSRNKAKFAAGYSNGQILFGLPNSSLAITDISECPLVMGGISRIVAEVKVLAKKHALSVYSIKKRSGELKYCIIRESTSGQIALRFVLRSRLEEHKIRALAEELLASEKILVVVSINIQPDHSAIIEGEEEIFITTNKTITDKIGEFQFATSPQSFSQVTTPVAELLYQHAAKIAEKSRPTKVLDLYCGIGTFTAFLSQAAESLVGVEVSRSAIQDAESSIKLNSIQNATFQIADIDEWITIQPTLDFDLVVVNPPRRGLSKQVIEKLSASLAVKNIIYSSCNPVTMARDIKQLLPKFELQELQPFDMFPLQPHVECLAHLIRRAE